ncbi:hypothetical protein [Persicitalea sp.]|uniref:hypothetical protein n=1 Tax=Persicitalea sp. TaxID=3100273 RepID=UPI003592F3D2
MRNIVFIVLVYAAILVLIRCFFDYTGYSPNTTGPIGDTISGVLSPLFGIISVYLLYETFKAQNEQLTDQKDTNLTQMSFLYLEDFKKMAIDFELENHKYFFEVPVNGASILPAGVNHLGYSAIKNFADYYENLTPQPQIHVSSIGLIEKVNIQTEDILSIFKRLELLNEKLTIDHFEYSKIIFDRLFKIHITNSESVFVPVRKFLITIKSELENATDEDKMQIAFRDTSIGIIEELWKNYEKIIEVFIKKEKVERYNIENKSFFEALEEFNEREISDIDWNVRYRVKL